MSYFKIRLSFTSSHQCKLELVSGTHPMTSHIWLNTFSNVTCSQRHAILFTRYTHSNGLIQEFTSLSLIFEVINRSLSPTYFVSHIYLDCARFLQALLQNLKNPKKQVKRDGLAYSQGSVENFRLKVSIYVSVCVYILVMFLIIKRSSFVIT